VKLFIGSCAKSGTHSVTEFLNRIEVNVAHENLGLDGIVTWYIFGTPDFFPFKFNIDEDNSICLHQTREPLATISSLMKLDQTSWQYIRKYMQMDLARPLLVRCMEYYYYWHKSLESCPFSFSVENLRELIDILDLFKVPYNPNKIDWALATPRLGATHIKPNLTWADLRQANKQYYKKIIRMAQDYGYSTN
jgi:hypothetical protein